MTFRKRAPLVLLVFLLAAPPWARAQTADGSIRGRITDEQGAALPGVTLTAHSPNTGGAYSAVSDAEGHYRLVNLSPARDYALSAELKGFTRFERTALDVRAGLNISLDVKLQVGGLTETVQVDSGETPMLETIKTVQAVNISGELVRALPLTGRRDWSDVLQLTPGTVSASTDAFGGQVYFLRGSENENHVMALDGADIGSFGQNWPSNFISLSPDALGDVEVKTGAHDAAAPSAMGYVINVHTPTGSDRFQGSFGAAFTPRSWNGNNTEGGTSPISEVVQPDFSLGGPIVKGKAWFFASARYIYRNDGISRDARQLGILQSLDPSFAPFDNESRAWVYLANASVELSPRHRLYGFVQNDSRKQGSNFQNYAGPYAPNQFGGVAFGARVTSVWNANLTTRVLASYNNKGSNTDASIYDGAGSGPSVSVNDSAFPSAGKLVGSGQIAVLGNLPSRTLSPASKPTLSADLTYYVPRGFGSHELQGGVYLQPHLRQKTTTLYSNDGFAQEESILRIPGNPASGLIPFHRSYYDTPTLVTSDIGADDYAAYVQDTWRPTDRLTVNAGLRADWVRSQDLLFGVDTSKAWNLGPRAGATYALTADRRHIVRASWGRVHDIPNASYLGTAGTTRAGLRDDYDLDLDGVFETSFLTPASTALATNRQIDPDRHQGYIDEWIVGYRAQLPGQVAVDVSVVNRAYKDRPALVEVNGIYDGNVFRGYQDVAFNDIYLSTNNRWNWFVYQGLELTAHKRTASLQLFTTYTLALEHIAGTWQPNDPASFIQPGTFANDAGLGSVRGNVTNSLGADTRNRSWEKHMWRTGISWSAPWKLRLATDLSLQSGTPSGPITTNLAAPDPQFGPTTLRLSNGRLVSNPLATTLRFVGQDRGDGQLWTPWLNVWNIRVGREFALAGSRLDLALDVFNVTNNGADQQFISGGNQINSANYGLLTNRQLPRSFQASFRLQF